MHRRTAAAVAAVAALGASAVAVAPASAAKNTVTLKGGTIFKAGKFIKDDQRFQTPKNNKVKAGATVKVVNRTKNHEPHTLTFVEKQFVPTSFDINEDLNNNLLAAHQVDPTNEEAPPGVLTVDDGQPLAAGATWDVDSAFSDTNANGDSAFIAPDQNGPSFTVGAPKGSTLYFFCAIHPWMSGKLKVK
jgi:plastocyanin